MSVSHTAQTVSLCVAGSTYSDPFGKSVSVTSYEERVKLIEQTAARVKAADSVLVIGGGIVRPCPAGTRPRDAAVT